jgi:hypothetical protein
VHFALLSPLQQGQLDVFAKTEKNEKNFKKVLDKKGKG